MMQLSLFEVLLMLRLLILLCVFSLALIYLPNANADPISVGLSEGDDAGGYTGDTFAAAGSSTDYSSARKDLPYLHGATSGTIAPQPLDRTIISGYNKLALTPEVARKIGRFQSGMDSSLDKADLSQFALNAYKLHALGGDIAFKYLADLACGEAELNSTIVAELVGHEDILRKILAIQGKEEKYLLMLEESSTFDSDSADTLARSRVEVLSALGGSAEDRHLSALGLRKFGSDELRVYVEPGDGTKYYHMLRRAVQHALTELCSATGGRLRYTLVADQIVSNVDISFDRHGTLWYEFQRHGSKTICEPLNTVAISRAQIKAPWKATMHRGVTEHELQEYCLRELAVVIGSSWHPVSRETLSSEFPNEVKIAKVRAYYYSPADALRELSALHGAPFIRRAINLAMTQDEESFPFYAGLAYFAKGNYDTAKRHFCNATSLFINNPDLLHHVVNRFIGIGDAEGAELIAFACINDDPENDSKSPATVEYNRIKKMKMTAYSALPSLSAGDKATIAKLYPPITAAANKPPVASPAHQASR